MCSHPDCLTFSALALRLQFTYAAFHRFACDGRYHARTDGGEYLPLSSPYSPATKPGCSAKAGGQWQKVRCLIEYSVFKLHTRRRAEAVTGSGAGAHLEKMPSQYRRRKRVFYARFVKKLFNFLRRLLTLCCPMPYCEASSFCVASSNT